MINYYQTILLYYYIYQSTATMIIRQLSAMPAVPLGPIGVQCFVAQADKAIVVAVVECNLGAVEGTTK